MLRSLTESMLAGTLLSDYCCEVAQQSQVGSSLSQVQFNECTIERAVNRFVLENKVQIDENEKSHSYALYRGLFLLSGDLEKLEPASKTEAREVEEYQMANLDSYEMIYPGQLPQESQKHICSEASDSPQRALDKKQLIRLLFQQIFKYHLLSECFGGHCLSDRKYVPRYQFGNILYCDITQVKKVVNFKVGQKSRLASYLKLNYSRNPLSSNAELSDWVKLSLKDQYVLSLTLSPRDRATTRYAI